MESLTIEPALLSVIGVIVIIFFGSIGYGVYNIFGPGAKDLIDPISEHSRMHEEGIPHSHGGASYHRH